MSEERVVEALKALRDADRECEAGPQVEVRLMRAVDKEHGGVRRRRSLRGRPTWNLRFLVLGGAVAAAAVVILMHARRSDPIPQVSPPKVVAVAAEPAPAVAEAPSPPRPKPRPARPKPWVLREVTTDFYPLMEVAPPFEDGELIRVTVPAYTMRAVGLFVDGSDLDDPIQADVLVGQEGVVRAIRFVSFEMKEKI